MEKILQINGQESSEHDPTNPTGFGQIRVEWLENGKQRETIEEQSEQIIEYILKMEIEFNPNIFKINCI